MGSRSEFNVINSGIGDDMGDNFRGLQQFKSVHKSMTQCIQSNS